MTFPRNRPPRTIGHGITCLLNQSRELKAKFQRSLFFASTTNKRAQLRIAKRPDASPFHASALKSSIPGHTWVE